MPVATTKKHATGKGNADKAAVVAAARKQGHYPLDDNEADALAFLGWAMAQAQSCPLRKPDVWER